MILDVLTADWLKSTFLAGVDLTLDDGTAFDDRVFTDSLKHAVALLEHELGIQIDPYSHTDERHDGEREGGQSFWPMRLDHRPVISIDKVVLQYGTFTPTPLPTPWANVVNWEHAQVHLIPNQEGLGSFKFSGGVPLILGDMYQPEHWVPGYFHLSYTAGYQVQRGVVEIPEGETSAEVKFAVPMRLKYSDVPLALVAGADGRGVSSYSLSARGSEGFTVSLSNAPVGGSLRLDWNATTLPWDLKRAIGLVASFLPLDIAGDLIAGAGIASLSVSMDGLHQSLGTTSSSTNSGYGARVLQYEKELKTLLPTLRAKFRIPGIAAI